MQRLGGLALMAVCTLAVPKPALAQVTCGAQWKLPPVGGWAEWQSKEGKAKLALVGQEEKDGKPSYRIELASGGNVMQMVVPGFPWQMDQVNEMVVQQAGQAPMKMSGPMLDMMKSRMPQGGVGAIARKCASMKVIGEESVTVPAGTFKATHLKNDEGDEVWASADVPFTVVRFRGKGEETVLAGMGKDAKTAIVGTPTEMQGMGMPRN